MSGHSKWHSIKHKKGALDAKRGKIFTKLIREMTIAARIGGGDPDSNPRLRTAIEKAKAANMPADNIKRAIQKGTGELEGTTYEEIILEGYGPGGVAILVEGHDRQPQPHRLRDPPRLHQERRQPGRGGQRRPTCSSRAATSPSPPPRSTEDKLMDIALEAGADDIQTSGDLFEIYTAPTVHDAVAQAIKKAGVEPEEAEIGKYAENNITLEGAEGPVRC